VSETYDDDFEITFKSESQKGDSSESQKKLSSSYKQKSLKQPVLTEEDLDEDLLLQEGR